MALYTWHLSQHTLGICISIQNTFFFVSYSFHVRPYICYHLKSNLFIFTELQNFYSVFCTLGGIECYIRSPFVFRLPWNLYFHPKYVLFVLFLSFQTVYLLLSERQFIRLYRPAKFYFLYVARNRILNTVPTSKCAI